MFSSQRAANEINSFGALTALVTVSQNSSGLAMRICGGTVFMASVGDSAESSGTARKYANLMSAEYGQQNHQIWAQH